VRRPRRPRRTSIRLRHFERDSHRVTVAPRLHKTVQSEHEGLPGAATARRCAAPASFARRSVLTHLGARGHPVRLGGGVLRSADERGRRGARAQARRHKSSIRCCRRLRPARSFLFIGSA
jgi:hypothetical protein